MSESTNSGQGTEATEDQQGWLKVWWPRAKAAAKGITGLAALGAAIVAIIAWFPLAKDAVWPELKEYEKLQALYAGASVSLFDGLLGPPSIVRLIPGDAGLTGRLYVKQDYVVETLATAEGETRLYSVLSCDPGFKPTFEFQNSQIILQDKPLSAQMGPDSPAFLYYVAPQTGSSEQLYFELIADISNATNLRGAGYGVNGACGKLPVTTNAIDNSAPGYAGPPDEAPQDIQDYRARTSANFYVEVREMFLKAEPEDSSDLPFGYVTPYHMNLPPRWLKSSSG